ncbi:hypothetical protein LTR09_007117 [Extremus antarcticus]|uniref:GPI anchored protein n=1 Tax=Extremus antarcticus TaxID=702011 RepID=A0AAJ0DKB0_9PEZI|nr:hypothetical protein LTR09_007117 [Extremus antarcticus]
MHTALFLVLCVALRLAAGGGLPQAIYDNDTIGTSSHHAMFARDVLELRQTCVAPGPTCPDGGYCCSDNKCCGSGSCIPLEDICCPGEYGCPPGYYCCGDDCAPEGSDCCGDGGHCPSGDTCTQQNCDYEWCCDGPNQTYDYYSYSYTYTLPSISLAPVPSSFAVSQTTSSSYAAASSSSADAESSSTGGGIIQYQYYYTTFTFYYLIWFQTTIRQAPTIVSKSLQRTLLSAGSAPLTYLFNQTSTTTTTTTLISVYAENREAAQAQFTSLEGTMQQQASRMASLSMPSIPSQTAVAGGTSSTNGAARSLPRGSSTTAAWVDLGGL